MYAIDFKSAKFVYTQDGTITMQVDVAHEGLDNEEGLRTIISCEMKDQLEALLGYEVEWYNNDS